MCLARILPFVLLMALAPAVAQAQIVVIPILLDCGFDERGRFVVHQVDTTHDAFVRGIRPGQDCIEAYATLRGRFATLERQGAEVRVGGPVIAELGDDSNAGGHIPGCDIWDFSSGTVVSSAATPSETPVAHAVLKCGRSEQGPLEVRFLGANRQALLPDLNLRSCVEARSALETHFLRLAESWGTKPTVRGPVAGRSASKGEEETLTWQIEVVWPH